MEHAPGDAESKEEYKKGDVVVLTNAGIRKLLQKGFTFKDFSPDTKLEIVEIKKHPPHDAAYVVKIPEPEGTKTDEVEIERGKVAREFE